MDIVRRAYFKTKGQYWGDLSFFHFHEEVNEEIMRLIRVGAYSKRDWPKELGPLPDEFRAKK